MCKVYDFFLIANVLQPRLLHLFDKRYSVTWVFRYIYIRAIRICPRYDPWYFQGYYLQDPSECYSPTSTILSTAQHLHIHTVHTIFFVLSLLLFPLCLPAHPSRTTMA